MGRISDFIAEKVTPPLAAMTQNRFVASLQGGFLKSMPIILIGAAIIIVKNILGLFAPAAAASIGVMYDLSWGLFAIVIALLTADGMAAHHGVNPTSVRLVAMSVFFILQKPIVTKEGTFQVAFDRLGATGVFIALIAGLLVGEVMGQWMKRAKRAAGSAGLPDFVREWFEPIVPGLIVIAVAWLVADILGLDLQSIIVAAVGPILKGSDGYIAFVSMVFILTALFTVGINGAVLFGFLFPLWFANVGENAALVAQGLAPTHINMIHTLATFCVLGGTGATLMLCVFMLGSKSTTLRALGRASIVPSLFNINEPLIFGLPVVFNPILAIPFAAIGGFVNPTITWLAMDLGLVQKPYVPALFAWMPPGVGAFLATQDWRSVVLVLVLLAVDGLLWLPFFKAYERVKIKAEAQAQA